MLFRRRVDALTKRFGNESFRPISEEEFPGILEEIRCNDLPSHEDTFRVDWMAVRTRLSMMPWTPKHLQVEVFSDLPIPGDMYRSDAGEYVALALSLMNDRSTYRIIEVGAAWAPWVVAGIVVARHRGKKAFGIAVEADELRASWAMQHATDNGINAVLIQGTSDEIRRQVTQHRHSHEMLVVQAACWHEESTLRFPSLDETDMGGAVTAEAHPAVDYRGAPIAHMDVSTVTMQTLLGDETTDLLHVDLQGQELEVIQPALDVLEQRVRLMSVGTHDRLIEGMLQHQLLQGGWALLLDDPCVGHFEDVRPTLAGFTVLDGHQLYANTQFPDTCATFVKSTGA